MNPLQNLIIKYKERMILNDLVKSIDKFIDNKENSSLETMKNYEFNFSEYKLIWTKAIRGYAIEINKGEDLILRYADQRRQLPTAFNKISDITCDDYNKLEDVKINFNKNLLNNRKRSKAKIRL